VWIASLVHRASLRWCVCFVFVVSLLRFTPHLSASVQDLDVHILDLSSAFLRLDSDQSAKTLFEREIITLDVSADETENASLVEKQICLLNLRNVARQHGFNLQQMHPDAFPITRNDA